MNSKGFVAPPLLIWVVIGLFAIVAVKNTYLEGGIPYGQSDLAKFNPTLDTTKEPTPASTPIANPSDLVNPIKQFYSDVSSQRYWDAWLLLSNNFQDYAQSYDNFVKGYKTTLSVVLKDIQVQDLSNNTVYIQLESKDDVGGQVQTKIFEGTWKLVVENGQWKLDSADIALKSISPTPKPVQPSVVPKPTSIPTPTPSPTPTPNSGKEQALKMIDEKINKINKDIAFWQSNIEAQIPQLDYCGNTYNPACMQSVTNTIADMRYRIDLLVAERNALERQKLQIMAQP